MAKDKKNTGIDNTGENNSGDGNAGNGNSGNWNAGYGNSTNRETGIFNTTEVSDELKSALKDLKEIEDRLITNSKEASTKGGEKTDE